MDDLGQLEAYSRQLSAAIHALGGCHRRLASSEQTGEESKSQDEDVDSAKAKILAIAASIRRTVSGPTDLLQHFVCQVELVACLRWLNEFQILACIPLQSSVPIRDVATLAGIQDHDHLTRVIRMVATHGFLQVKEPQGSMVSHTPLSTHFVTNQSYVDAVMFLAEVGLTSAMHMVDATQRSTTAGWTASNESAYNLALSTRTPFHVARQETPRLARGFTAYLNHSAGLHFAEEMADMLCQLNWSNLGNSCIVEMGATSKALARCLAKRYQGLRFVVQTDNSAAIALSDSLADNEEQDAASALIESRILVMDYPAAPRQRQSITDAAVYILHTDAIAPASMISQLQDHLGILRANGGIMLLLTNRCLPEPGVLANPEVEAVARARDLSMQQLAGETEWELVDLLNTIELVRDEGGKLVVTDRLRYRDDAIVALAVKYQVLVHGVAS